MLVKRLRVRVFSVRNGGFRHRRRSPCAPAPRSCTPPHRTAPKPAGQQAAAIVRAWARARRIVGVGYRAGYGRVTDNRVTPEGGGGPRDPPGGVRGEGGRRVRPGASGQRQLPEPRQLAGMNLYMTRTSCCEGSLRQRSERAAGSRRRVLYTGFGKESSVVWMTGSARLPTTATAEMSRAMKAY